ncbi:MAG: hypothetical protein IIT39_04490, partial [Clostridia bacterium]|nr:hypothetical protein [Clostridia bacterium]
DAIELLAEYKTAEELDEEESKAAEEASKKAVEEASKKAAEESKAAEEARRAAEKAAKELANAKNEAVESIESYVNPADYPSSVQGQIQSIIASARSTIMNDKVTSISLVEDVVKNAKQQIDDCIANAQVSEEPQSSEPEPPVESSEEVHEISVEEEE